MASHRDLSTIQTNAMSNELTQEQKQVIRNVIKEAILQNNPPLMRDYETLCQTVLSTVKTEDAARAFLKAFLS